MREAYRLDSEGKTAEARAIYRALADSATDPAAKARVYRSMAMSYAFDGDCANTAKYELMVIAYHMTREADDPQDAFYQQGEMADEAGRVCLDAGALDAADRLYRLGHELGVKEPEPVTHPRSLWDYRLSHALGRIAARRGNAAEAQFYVRNARRILDGDPQMAEQQARYLPYLEGYVALYTGDLATAEAKLTEAINTPGNQRDAFMRVLLAMTYERLGREADALAMYREAYDRATSHNPPGAFVRPFARAKLGLTGSP
jgi:tetratricopeptide (TPR) repeat protein